MTAYYNENDAKAAAWLRELIKDDQIAPGDVDERDIRDISPGDLAGYDQCHFFAGIGGWAHALRLAGWPDDRPVWTGSCPCQPFSAAGKRGGTSDERHLWPAWFHLIGECQPRVVFGEQVASKDGLGWLDLVQADLEGAGYASGALDLCAAGFGAPHIRQRLWIVAERLADAERNGPQGRIRGRANPKRETLDGSPGRGGADVWVADSPTDGRREERQDGGRRGSGDSAQGFASGLGAGGGGRGVVDSDSAGSQPGQRNDTPARHGHSIAAAGDDGGVADSHGRERDGIAGSEGRNRDGAQAGRIESDSEFERRGADGGLADAYRHRAERGARYDAETLAGSEGPREPKYDTDVPERGGADHDRRGDVCGYGVSGGAGGPGPTNGIWRDADWLFCRDGKWRPVEPGTFPLAHGLSARVGRLRGYGNAIVPQVAAEVIEAYLDTRTASRVT